MSAKRGASGLSGILLVDKPQGMTSHDVVNRVRRATGERRVGHAGTLDPMATGLLVVLVGPATRLAPYLTAAEKSYAATVTFGSETDTDDAEGEVTITAQVPETLLDPAFAAEKVAALVGTHEQVPPAYSAIKRGGVVAHRAARDGEALELEARTIEVTDARLLAVHAEPPAWELEASVSKGTYIRALARDLGRSLGTAAHLSALRRTSSGSLTAEDAVPLASIEAAESAETVAALFVDPLSALGMPIVQVNADGALRVAAGSVLDAEAHCEPGGACPAQGEVALARSSATGEDVLLAIYRVSGGSLRAVTVLPGGVSAGACA